MPRYHVNLPPSDLIQWALKLEKDTTLTNTGALSVNSYLYKGRVPKAKRIVDTPDVTKDVDWGDVNIKMTSAAFEGAKARAKAFIESRDEVFVVNAFAGHDKKYRIKIRIFCTRPYHALFIRNMLIVPTAEELGSFGAPEFVIYNAGELQTDMLSPLPGVPADACVALNFQTREQVILGTQYAGEMKKGVLTVMMYVMPKKGQLCMHASANESKQTGAVTVFFGLSGTGKTTLSADERRNLIGDDEHVWTDQGVYNIEGGCYAKAVGLTEKTEPEIFRAVRYGAVAENCILVPGTKEINYFNLALTENTRVAYPLSFIPSAKTVAVGKHPNHILFLTNDAFGVLPPVSLLTRAQAMFWFITGYTAKVAGTEEGVKDPSPTFSACFGAPFLVFHPTYYGKQLADLLEKHNAKCWLVNTGYSGGAFPEGKRMKLSITRALIDGIHDGTLEKGEFETLSGWGLRIPKKSTNPAVPQRVLNPYNAWEDKAKFVRTIDKLSGMFVKNFRKYEAKASPEVLAARPGAFQAPSAGSKL